MSIRLRESNGVLIALCAAETDAEPGDRYLDDSEHYALAAKFAHDWQGQTIDWKCPDEWAEMAKHKKRDAQEELDAWLAEIERPCPTCGEPDPTEAVMADCSLCTPTFDLPRGYFGDGTTPERHLDTTREE